MPKAVQLSAYGGVDQLAIVEVAKPEPQPDEVVVRVVAAGTNPGEISIREGLLRDRFPMDFPFGQGTDFAGRVDSVGAKVVGLAPGDEVLGWSERRSAQAEYVVRLAVALGIAPERINTIIDFAGVQMKRARATFGLRSPARRRGSSPNVSGRGEGHGT